MTTRCHRRVRLARRPTGLRVASDFGSLAERTDLLPGIESQAFIDIDSLLQPAYGQAKQGAGFGHTKIPGKQVLCKGLSPPASTISTRHSAPVVVGIRLRRGKSGSGKGAASMVREAITTARAAGATGEILVRGDSATARARSWSRA